MKYYYFHTKEEIFLALLQREYETWIADLTAIRQSHQQMTADQFADELARSLERRSRLLKLMSMNHYVFLSIYEITKFMAVKLLRGFE